MRRRQAPPKPMRLTLVLIQHTAADGCLWPLAEDRDGLHLFCNDRRLPPFAYCQRHYRQSCGSKRA